MFISQDPDLKRLLMDEDSGVLLYNPREDNIPMDYVDIVISEKCWQARLLERDWTGEAISKREKNSKVEDRLAVEKE